MWKTRTLREKETNTEIMLGTSSDLSIITENTRLRLPDIKIETPNPKIMIRCVRTDMDVTQVVSYIYMQNLVQMDYRKKRKKNKCRWLDVRTVSQQRIRISFSAMSAHIVHSDMRTCTKESLWKQHWYVFVSLYHSSLHHSNEHIVYCTGWVETQRQICIWCDCILPVFRIT